jgi:hypothetical protein
VQSHVGNGPSELQSAPTHSEPAPLTIDALRRKLDAAIDAEAWEAVKIIRERIVEVERAQVGNVVKLDRLRR